jgi:hypothetical protein
MDSDAIAQHKRKTKEGENGRIEDTRDNDRGEKRKED